jgi:glycosyltransferase involved in cell wall biosynthesis
VPRVSIIVPTYNRPALLPRALASVANQTFRDFEVIVINDGGNCPYVDKSLSGFGKTKFFSKNWGGPGSARNRGLDLSDSEFVAYLDDDDEWFPIHLERLISTLNQNPKSKIVYGSADLVDAGLPVRRWGHSKFNKFVLDGFYTIFPLTTCIHRREILLKTHNFDENPLLIGPEDCEFMIRASDHDFPLAAMEVTARMHRDQSMTKPTRCKWVDALAYVIEKNGYGARRRNWLMFYRAYIAAIEENRSDFIDAWAEQLDIQLPNTLKRVGDNIIGDISLFPHDIKTFCRNTLSCVSDVN